MNPVGPYNPYAEKQGLCAIRVFTDGSHGSVTYRPVALDPSRMIPHR